MVSKVGRVLAVAILAALACTGYAIKCYQCESVSSPKCGEKFEADDSLLLDCARIAPPRFLQTFLPVRNATGCMKKTIDGVPGHPQVVRSCYFGDISNTQVGCQGDPSMPFLKQLSCEVCNKDECNGSASLAPIAGAILLFFGVARLLA
ncbi:UPAR/Ly6 domain-containing protein bero-like [Drosophila montana]|uniref:UPAR/Ly6 domain-containing protein bero-like n=1 Tax=Drosophila montana TaxID=40370 RepID=UPI00313CEBC2